MAYRNDRPPVNTGSVQPIPAEVIPEALPLPQQIDSSPEAAVR